MLTLLRYNYSKVAVLGHIFHEKRYICDTLELPWIENKPFISCIPEGKYALVYRKGDAFKVKEGYLLEDVKDRQGILIHVANSVNQLEGCIGVGVKSSFMLYNSRDTFLKLVSIIGKSDELSIIKVDSLCL